MKRAIDLAYNRIYKFHSFQKFKNISYTDNLKNKLEYKYVPIEAVAIYVPGSTASYPSSVLMNAVPAIVAGVKRLVMINPGQKGVQNPAVLYAAKKCQIKELRLIPRNGVVWVEYVHESLTEKAPSCSLEVTGVLGIDHGINNWLTCASSNGKPFIIDGHKLKSWNQLTSKIIMCPCAKTVILKM